MNPLWLRAFDVLAGVAGLIDFIGGLAVLSQCSRFSFSWRALSGVAVAITGAVGVWDARDGFIDFEFGLAVCAMAVPVSNVLYRIWMHEPARRITDLMMFDETPHHHSQGGRVGVSQILVAVFVAIFFAMVYAPAKAADEAPCDPATGSNHISGWGDGCKWAAWVCPPRDEFGDYWISKAVCLDGFNCLAAFVGMNHRQIVEQRTVSMDDPRVRKCMAPSDERIESIRPPSRWVTAPNPTGAYPLSRPVYHALDGRVLGAQYPSNVAVAPVGWPCDPASLRAIKGNSVYGRPKGWRGDMVTLCRRR